MIALDNGFEEVVGIVADVEASAARLMAATGYVEIARGAVDAGALALLGMAGRPAREVLIGHRDVARGRIRLIALDGEAAPLARDGAQAWDTGGIFDINLRALGGNAPIERLHRRLGDAGYLAHAPITDWDFGPLAVREVVESDADGLCIALMERVRPPLAGYEGVSGPASWVFNSTQVVADFDAARRFYRDVLGWLPVQETEGPVAQASGVNCMGLPVGLAAGLTMRIGIYHPAGRMEGSVEIIGFGMKTLDFSASQPPMRGWASLRFPMSDIDGFAQKAREAGCAIIGPIEAEWRPHGRTRAVAAITPWGARVEAFEMQAGA
ncbi:MAG TPA: VOC family protein [Novosphingobium sp.]|nr:VOC family protein [Novosphingobium sp.]